jgi:hypothetical protein
MPLAGVLTAIALAGAEPPPAAWELPPDEVEGLRAQLGQMHAAARSGDFARVVKFTYARVVQGFGGPAGALRAMARMREQMAADGAEIYRSEVAPAAPACVRAGERVQCVVGGAHYVRVAGKEYRGETQTLAFSEDGGRHWTFASVVDPTSVRTELPEVSPDLPLRELPGPVELGRGP